MDLRTKQLRDCLPAWWGPLVGRSARFVLSGPKWVPLHIRRIPLNLLCKYGAVCVLYGALGYGGRAPHGDK